MEFTLSPPPRLQQPFRPDPRGPVGEDGGYEVFVFPPVLPAGSPTGWIPRRLFSTSFKLRSWVVPPYTTVLPLTWLAEEAGAVHVLIDVASYGGSGYAIAWLREQATRGSDWLLNSNDLLDYGQIARFVAGRPHLEDWEGNVRLVVEYPPMWLADP